MTQYDIIGDIHGQPEKLDFLLRRLGYQHRSGAWRHPERQAVFVGDFVDRGPGQIQTLDAVRRMVEAGSGQAVLGNHEFNAIAWHTLDPQDPGQHLRKHSEKNRKQHQRFLEEVGDGSRLHDEWIAWFMSLPLWLELDGFRVVHACWHPAHMQTLSSRMGPNNTLTPELLVAASRPGSAEFVALESICKGLEIKLPTGVSYLDAEGTERTSSRVRWWDETANTYRKAALLPPAQSDQLPDTPLPVEAMVAYDGKKPVFFGHYWLTGDPRVISPVACCVDYSAARDGHPLVAYQWQGEGALTDDHLVAVLPGTTPHLSRARP